MDKNPISFLQEYAMLEIKALPNYYIVKQNVGTHINSFHMRVELQGVQADGHGSSKKTAKLNAAVNLISKLNIKPKNGYQDPSKNLHSSFTDNFNNSYEPSSNNVNCSFSDNLNSSSDDLNSFQSTRSCGINYIGKLQEYASTFTNGALPGYEFPVMTGPSHKPQFTCLCKYNGLEEKAVGYTKKEAKSLAAEKMYNLVSSNFKIMFPNNLNIKSYLDNISIGMEQLHCADETDTLLKKSAEKAVEEFPKLSKTVMNDKLKDQSRPVSEYYSFLKDSYSLTARQSVIKQLLHIIESWKSFVSGTSGVNPMNMLKAALAELSIEIEDFQPVTKMKIFSYGLRLNTNPVISEIAFGSSVKIAQINAVYLIARTVHLLLS